MAAAAAAKLNINAAKTAEYVVPKLPLLGETFAILLYRLLERISHFCTVSRRYLLQDTYSRSRHIIHLIY